MNRTPGSWTVSSYRGLFFVNHSRLLFFSSSFRKANDAGVKYGSGSISGHLQSPGIGAGHGTSPPRIYFPKSGANGRASKTTRIDAIRSPFTRYHSQMNAVPAGVFVTMSYSMQTSSPSTNIFFGSTRSMMWWSFWRASMYGSGLRNESHWPTNERSSWRNRRAPPQSPPPRAFWYPRTLAFAPGLGSLLPRGTGGGGPPPTPRSAPPA